MKWMNVSAKEPVGPHCTGSVMCQSRCGCRPPVQTQTWASLMLIVRLTMYFSMRKVRLGLLAHLVRFFQQCFPVVTPVLRGEPASSRSKLFRLIVRLRRCLWNKGKASLRSRRPQFITLHRSPLNGDVVNT